jgi:hypothetical protein
MLRLRLNILLLLLFTGFILNIERVDFGAKEDVINLASFVYLLYGAAIVSTILIPKKWKVSTPTIVIFWVAIYSILKIFIFNDRPVVGGIYTYLMITEIVSLVVLVLLIRRVMESVQGLQETVANITLADVSDRVIGLDLATKNINLEFARSRRYRRPLGVVVIKMAEESIQAKIDDLSKDILDSVRSHYSISNLIRAIDSELRRPDLILEDRREKRIILLLPESDVEGNREVSERVQQIAESRIGSPVGIGTATFPEDAVIFEDLVNFAERSINERHPVKSEDNPEKDLDVKYSKTASS